ncbi:MAG: hypothetical protein PT977_04950 [Acidobacteriota bacterium]|nr:hypothetical protein [Acidobacteriota bacterium]
MSEPFNDQESASLYLAWRLGRPLECPACSGVVSSSEEAKPGWSRSRRFTCESCGRDGAHLVPDDASGPLG